MLRNRVSCDDEVESGAGKVTHRCDNEDKKEEIAGIEAIVM